MLDGEGELAAELEALQYTYEDDKLTVVQDGSSPLVLTAMVQPYTGVAGVGGEQGTVFVQLKLQLSVPAGYPDQLPEIALLEAKGMGDARQAALMQHLRAEAEGLQGSMMLGHLIETATSFVTEHNQPEGTCAFCLEPLHVPDSGTADGSSLVNLPCFHAFHRSCYCGWWSWQQQDTAQRKQDLVQHTGAAATNMLLADKLPPQEAPPYEHLYTTSCPVCRAPCPLADIAHLLPALMDALAHTISHQDSSQSAQPLASGGGGDSQTQAVSPHDRDLAPKLAAMQRRHQQLFARQQAAGGIIGADGGACISMARLAISSGGAEGGTSALASVPVPAQGPGTAASSTGNATAGQGCAARGQGQRAPAGGNRGAGRRPGSTQHQQPRQAQHQHQQNQHQQRQGHDGPARPDAAAGQQHQRHEHQHQQPGRGRGHGHGVPRHHSSGGNSEGGARQKDGQNLAV